MVDITGLFGSFDPIGAYAKGAALRKGWDTDAARKAALSGVTFDADGNGMRSAVESLFRAGDLDGAAKIASVGGDLQKAAQEKAFLASVGGLFGGGSGQSATSMQPQPMGAQSGDMAGYSNAISKVESGGRYDAMGPTTKSGDKAHGKYQIMGANIPQWTQEALGRPMTPQEFLASPDAQEATFKHKFGQYVAKYGPEGAARAWFAGEGGMNDMGRKDVLGTSVADYSAKFLNGMGGGAAPTGRPVQMAQAGGQEVSPVVKAMILSPNPATRAQGLALLAQAQGKVDPVAREIQQLDLAKKKREAANVDYEYQKAPDGTVYQREKGKPNAPWEKSLSLPEKPDTIKFDDISSIRKEISGLPEVKRYSEALPAYNTMVKAGTNPSAAGDLAFVYGIAKVFDPDSVVREGEMKFSSNAQSMPDKVIGAINAVVAGGTRLSEDVKRELIQITQERMQEMRGQYDERIAGYQPVFENYKIKPELVVPKMRDVLPVPPIRKVTASTPAPAQGAATPKTIDGWQEAPNMPGVRIREKR